MIAAGSPAPGQCELLSCANPDVVEADHPQRGPMAVCGYHARNIRELPERQWWSR